MATTTRFGNMSKPATSTLKTNTLKANCLYWWRTVNIATKVFSVSQMLPSATEHQNNSFKIVNLYVLISRNAKPIWLLDCLKKYHNCWDETVLPMTKSYPETVNAFFPAHPLLPLQGY